MDRKICLCSRTVNDGGPCGLCQIQVTRHKVCMKMRLKNIFDGGVALFCKPEICVDIAQRVDDSSLPLAINVIGRFTETAGIQLLNEHYFAFAAKIVIISTPVGSGC